MRSACVAMVLAALLPACGAADAPLSPESESRLRERIASVHAAIGANDVQAWYAATPPSTRRRLGFEDFKRDIRWDAVGAKSPPARWQAELGTLCSCRGGSAPRCVVSVRVDMQEPGKDAVRDFPLETWDYEQGEWYLAYIGASTAGRCPGAR